MKKIFNQYVIDSIKNWLFICLQADQIKPVKCSYNPLAGEKPYSKEELAMIDASVKQKNMKIEQINRLLIEKNEKRIIFKLLKHVLGGLSTTQQEHDVLSENRNLNNVKVEI
jgi:hypothetical protein